MNRFTKIISVLAIVVAITGAILPSGGRAGFFGTPTGGFGVDVPDAPTAPGGVVSFPTGGWGGKGK